MHVAAGQLRGQTLLPLPPVSAANLADPGRLDQGVLRVLEGAAVCWARLVRGVLAADPDAPLKAPGAHPGPLAELDYWDDRAARLGSVCAQLCAPRAAAVVSALEGAGSGYARTLQSLGREVGAALAAAEETARALRPLRPLLERMGTSDDFVLLPSLFKPLLHTLLLAWQHAPAWATPPRLVALVREVCNDLIAQARRFAPGGCAGVCVSVWRGGERGGGWDEARQS